MNPSCMRSLAGTGMRLYLCIVTMPRRGCAGQTIVTMMFCLGIDLLEGLKDDIAAKVCFAIHVTFLFCLPSWAVVGLHTYIRNFR